MPRFTHDCDMCRFLGDIDGQDAYVCKTSYVIRYSGIGHHYRSVPKELVSRAGGDFQDLLKLLRGERLDD